MSSLQLYYTTIANSFAVKVMPSVTGNTRFVYSTHRVLDTVYLVLITYYTLIKFIFITHIIHNKKGAWVGSRVHTHCLHLHDPMHVASVELMAEV